MKILLTTLNSKYVHSNLALKYLYTNMIDGGYPKEMITLQEFTINNEEDYIFGEIVRGGFDILCISCYIWNIDKTLTICENIKKANPKVKIILGGPEVSYDSDLFLRMHPYIDSIAPGEQKNLPFPYKYLEPEKDKVIYYESMRGCPFKCSYCLSSDDKAVECLPLSRVLEELDFFLSHNVKQVKFIDRTFNFDSKRAIAVIEHLKSNDNGITNFHLEMSPEIITEELIASLKTARKDLFQLEMGIQSTNKQTLQEINRVSHFAKARKNIQKILEVGNIHIHLDLIAGLPLETYESFQMSFNDVYKIKPDNLQLGFLKMIKGTPIRGQVSDHGYIYRSNAPYEVIANQYITAGELLELKKVEHVLDLFYNRGGFHNTLDFCVQGIKEPPFRFFNELADYFYANGCQHRSWKKEDLYKILHEFIVQRAAYSSANLQKLWAGKDLVAEIKKLIFTDMVATLNEDAVKRQIKKHPFLEGKNA